MNGLMTECEWRKRTIQKRVKRGTWCGAQCVRPTLSRSHRLKHDPAFRLFLLLCSLTLAASLPLLLPYRAEEKVADHQVAASIAETSVPRSVSEIGYALPPGSNQPHIFTRAQLLRGSMMLLDEAHPLPKDALPPNTYSIAAQGNAMVPVASLNIQSGRETIAALKKLFAALRSQKAEGLAVWQGTVSAAQQRQKRRRAMAEQMHEHTPLESRSRVTAQLDAPNAGEMQQEHAVEIRLRTVPDQPLEASRSGQTLLQLAWKYGFVRTDPENRPFRFRYVGAAHATAMTYLDVDLQEYLLWLHRKGQLTISDGDGLRYLILCRPLSGEHVAFDLPADASYEISLDNMGYAVVACTW